MIPEKKESICQTQVWKITKSMIINRNLQVAAIIEEQTIRHQLLFCRMIFTVMKFSMVTKSIIKSTWSISLILDPVEAWKKKNNNQESKLQPKLKSKEARKVWYRKDHQVTSIRTCWNRYPSKTAPIIMKLNQ